MYALVNPDGDLIHQIKCFACSLEPPIPISNVKCHTTLLTDNQAQHLWWYPDSCQKFPRISRCLDDIMLEWSRFPTARLVEVECQICENPNHNTCHAIGYVNILETYHAPQQVLCMIHDTTPAYYKHLLVKAIRENDHVMYCHVSKYNQFVTQDDLFYALELKFCANLDSITAFLQQYGIMSDIQALMYHIFTSKYHAYRKYLVSISDATISDHHDLMMAIKSTQSEARALEVFQDLRLCGLRVDSATLRTQQSIFCHDWRPKSANQNISHRLIFQQILDMNSDIDSDILRDIFAYVFQANINIEADWSFVPRDIVMQALPQIINFSRPKMDAFQKYLNIFLIDMAEAEYRCLFLEIFNRDYHIAKSLLPMINFDGDFRAKCQIAYQNHDFNHPVGKDWMIFITKHLEIVDSVEFYVKAFENNMFFLNTFLYLLQNLELDWNCRIRKSAVFPVPKVYRTISMANVENFSVAELLFFHDSSTINVSIMAKDLGLDLEYDNLREILLSINFDPEDCPENHRICFFVNLASKQNIYAAIRCLYKMRPTDTEIAEIWSAVQTVYGKKKIKNSASGIGDENLRWFREITTLQNITASMAYSAHHHSVLS